MDADAAKVKDVVCAMMIDPETAAAVRVYEGETFHFCSQGCARAFDDDPKNYVQAISRQLPFRPRDRQGRSDGRGSQTRNEGGMTAASDSMPPGVRKPLTVDRAVEQARKYLQAWGDEDLSLSEVMEFSNHYYVAVAEKGTDRRAFGLLLNKDTGQIVPEPGPNMVWNLKYGPMAGGTTAGLHQPDQGGKMPVTTAKAHALAQKVLDAQGQGLKVEDGADQFYGYYTIRTLKDGQIYGMLGVNGFTGQVWLHSWHGTYVRTKVLKAVKYKKPGSSSSGRGRPSA